MGSKERGEDYKYLQIADAMTAINQRVNLFGIVIDSTIPKKSRGTDCFVKLSVMDESRQSPGIPVNIFAENMGKLPQVQCNGDLIQLLNVVMKIHNSEVYAIFNKNYSSFALFEGKHGTSLVPYQVSPKFQGRVQDKKLIAYLREWLVDKQIDTGIGDSFLLKEIEENKCFNLVCKVLHICEVTKGDWVVFVWDGTDTPPVTFLKKPEDEMEDPLRLHVESLPMPRDVLCMFPTVGTILRVVVENDNENLGLHVLKTGRWVKLINIRCETQDGLWRGVLMPSTKIRYLMDDEELVLRRQRFYDERVTLELGRMPLSCFPWPSPVTETDSPDQPFSTLMDVLSFPEVTARFKCVVRVVAAFPWWAEDFRSPRGTFRIRLTLEDPTARVHAFVYGDDGVDFFGGSDTIDELTRKRNMLLGITENNRGTDYKDALRNAPWVQCCLKSYYLDKSNPWGSRNFRIDGTRMSYLVDDE